MAQARADLVWRVRANRPSTEDQRTGRRTLPAINMRGDVLVAQALPEATEVTRLRRTFQAIEATASVPDNPGLGQRALAWVKVKENRDAALWVAKWTGLAWALIKKLG